MAKSEIYNNESLHKAERKEMIRECRKDKMKIMAEKILIITGGYSRLLSGRRRLSAKTYDYCIAADSGLVHADKLGTGWITFWGITIRLMKGCLVPIKKIRRQ